MSNGWPGLVPGKFSFGCEDSSLERAAVRNTSDLVSRLINPTVTMIAVALAVLGQLTGSVTVFVVPAGAGEC
jgi:hypothetical protein